MVFLRKYSFVGYVLFILGMGLLIPLMIFTQTSGPDIDVFRLSKDPLFLIFAILAFLGCLFLLIGIPWTSLVLAFPDKEKAKANFGRTSDAFAAVFLFILLQVLLGVPVVLLMGIGAAVSGMSWLLTNSAVIGPALVISAISMIIIFHTRGIRTGALQWKDLHFNLAGGKYIVVGLVGGVLTLVAASLVEVLLQSFGLEQSQMAVFPGKDSHLVVKAITLVGGAVVAPIVEEIFFRGYIFRGLWLRQGAMRGYLISATLFSAAHMNLEAFLPILVSGLCLAYLYKRTDNLIPPVIAHSMNNAIALAIHLF